MYVPLFKFNIIPECQCRLDGIYFCVEDWNKDEVKVCAHEHAHANTFVVHAAADGEVAIPALL